MFEISPYAMIKLRRRGRKNKQTQRTERILTKSGSSMDWIAVKHCYRSPESPTGKISSL